MPKIHQGFGQIFKWADKKGQIWQEVIKGLTKSWLQRCHKGPFWQMAIITEMTNLATIHKVWQKLNEMTNEACWLFGIFAKMTNLVKIANLAISNEWLAKNSKEMAKNGLLVIRDFTRTANLGENGKFGKNTWKVWTKFKWEDSKGYFDNYWCFEESRFLPKMVNLTNAYQMFGKSS